MPESENGLHSQTLCKNNTQNDTPKKRQTFITLYHNGYKVFLLYMKTTP